MTHLEIDGLVEWLAKIISAIDAGQIPLYIAVEITPERMQEAWDACNDPLVLHSMLARTHPQEALLPLARHIAAATGVSLSYLDTVWDVVQGSQRWRDYRFDLIGGSIQSKGWSVINKLLSWGELPLAWMDREGLFRPGILDSPAALLPFLRAAGPPTLEAVVQATEGFR